MGTSPPVGHQLQFAFLQAGVEVPYLYLHEFLEPFADGFEPLVEKGLYLALLVGGAEIDPVAGDVAGQGADILGALPG